MTKRQDTHFQYIILIALIFLGVATRFLPHPANVTAVGAAALFAGVFFPKRWGMWLPLLIMVASDLVIGWHKLVLFTWGSMAIYGLIGWYVRSKKKTGTIILGTLCGSTLFFLITNWAVWQFEAMYPHTLQGLVASYVAGLPFFRNMLIGDLLYVGALFAIFAMAQQIVKQRARPHMTTQRYE